MGFAICSTPLEQNYHLVVIVFPNFSFSVWKSEGLVGPMMDDTGINKFYFTMCCV